jgi:hypothetical protein
MTNQNIESRDLESRNINPETSTPGRQPQDVESQNVNPETSSPRRQPQDVELANQSANNPSQNSEKKCFKNSDKRLCLYHICFIIIMIAIVVITVYLTDIYLANPWPKGGNCTNDFANINNTLINPWLISPSMKIINELLFLSISQSFRFFKEKTKLL